MKHFFYFKYIKSLYLKSVWLVYSCLKALLSATVLSAAVAIVEENVCVQFVMVISTCSSSLLCTLAVGMDWGMLFLWSSLLWYFILHQSSRSSPEVAFVAVSPEMQQKLFWQESMSESWIFERIAEQMWGSTVVQLLHFNEGLLVRICFHSKQCFSSSWILAFFAWFLKGIY